MTWTSQPDSSAAVLAARFARAAEPFLQTAAVDAPGPPLWIRAIPGDSILVIIGYEARQFRATADGEIGDAMAGALGETLTAGLNRLPEAGRRAVAKHLEHDAATLALHLDLLFGDLSGLVVFDRGEVVLFTIRAGDAAN